MGYRLLTPFLPLANLLVEGDRLRSHDGETVVITAIVPTPESAPVYNLWVDEYHTYFVGNLEWGFSVWSHNTNYVDQIRKTGDGLDPLGQSDPGKYWPGTTQPTHGHHALFKKGIGEAQQALVDEGQAILRKLDIDPINGPENLFYAPNGNGHTIGLLEDLLVELRNVAKIPSKVKAREAAANTLKEFAQKYIDGVYKR